MKKSLIALGLAATVFLSGCAQSKVVQGETVQPYGLLNEDAVKRPGVKYQISPGNVVLAIIFSETIVVPIVVVGWALWEPVA